MSGTLQDARPKLRTGVLVSRPLQRGPAAVHLLADPSTGARFEVGPKEHFIITRLDGTRTLQQIGAEYAGRFRTRLDDARWQQILRLLHGRRLLDDGRPPAAAAAPEPPRSTLLRGHTRLVADAATAVDRLHRAVRPAGRPVPLAALGVLVAGLLVETARHIGELWADTGRLYHEPVTLCAVGAVLWVSLACHELAHAVVARAFGGSVTEIGMRWQLPATYLYCRVEDVRFMADRRRQVATAAAGALANLVFVLPLYPWWALLPPTAQAKPALGGLLLLGCATGLANLAPFPPLDGYKMLEYASGTLRLAGESSRFAGRAARRALGRGPGIAAYPARLRLLYSGYLVLCAALTAAGLLAAGRITAALLPHRYAAIGGWLPAAALGVLLVLWPAGLLARRLRGHAAAPSR